MFKIGDKVIITGNEENTHNFPVGTVGTVRDVLIKGFYLIWGPSPDTEGAYIGQVIREEELSKVEE